MCIVSTRVAYTNAVSRDTEQPFPKGGDARERPIHRVGAAREGPEVVQERLEVKDLVDRESRADVPEVGVESRVGGQLPLIGLEDVEVCQVEPNQGHARAQVHVVQGLAQKVPTSPQPCFEHVQAEKYLVHENGRPHNIA